MEDITMMSDDELAELAASTDSELARRRTLTDAARRTDEMALQYLRAQGRVNGGPYVAPVGFLGTYPCGWRVTEEGRTFEAIAPGVGTRPPGDGWREIEDPDSEQLVPFWAPGPYPKGAHVRDASRIWVALADVDGQRPSEYPGGWDLARDPAVVNDAEGDTP